MIKKHYTKTWELAYSRVIGHENLLSPGDCRPGNMEINEVPMQLGLVQGYAGAK